MNKKALPYNNLFYRKVFRGVSFAIFLILLLTLLSNVVHAQSSLKKVVMPKINLSELNKEWNEYLEEVANQPVYPPVPSIKDYKPRVVVIRGEVPDVKITPVLEPDSRGFVPGHLNSEEYDSAYFKAMQANEEWEKRSEKATAASSALQNISYNNSTVNKSASSKKMNWSYGLGIFLNEMSSFIEKIFWG